MTKLVLFALILFSGTLAYGKPFSNSYVSFQLPDNWSCKASNTEWVCRSANNEQAKQAIIVLTAKEVGPNDNFAYYNQYLKTPKTPKHRDGTVTTSSKVQHLKTVQIANHAWIDGLHMGSLLPNFYSRYLVTVKGRIAVLVTFSAKKEVYTKYSRVFFDAINSLRVIAPTQSIAKAGGAGGADYPAVDPLDPSEFPLEADDPAISSAKGSSSSKKLIYTAVPVVLILIAMALIIRSMLNKK